MSKFELKDAEGNTYTYDEMVETLADDLYKSQNVAKNRVSKKDANLRANECVRAWMRAASENEDRPARYHSAQNAMEAYLKYAALYKCARAGVNLMEYLGVDTSGREEPPLHEMADLYSSFRDAVDVVGIYKWCVWHDCYGPLNLSKSECRRRHNERMKKDLSGLIEMGGFLPAEDELFMSSKNTNRSRTTISHWLGEMADEIEHQLKIRGKFYFKSDKEQGE